MRYSKTWWAGALLLLLGFGIISASTAWVWSHGVLFGGVGALMIYGPPGCRMPRVWWGLAGSFLILSCACFLPAGWFGIPEWRTELERLGVYTGSLQVIQPELAAERLGIFAVTLFAGMWIASQRFDGRGLRVWPLVFGIMVAVIALLSKLFESHLADLGGFGHFGFFPNRNHTATLLAMGAVVALGYLIQALKEGRKFSAVLAAASGLINTGALCFWSVSRAGIVVLAVGILCYLLSLKRGYFRGGPARVLLLLGLAAGGGFLLSDSRVKQRLFNTSFLGGEESGLMTGATGAMPDLRFSIWVDSLSMIASAPWSGHGPGQFPFIFPQYREAASFSNESDSNHAESDWLWMAAENGVPATLALAGLVASAMAVAWFRIRKGRSQSVRMGCLAGAAVLLIHGFVDVPGHRIPLAWAACFLLAMALSDPDGPEPKSVRKSWSRVRYAGAPVIALGVWLLVASWRDKGLPALTAAPEAVKAAKNLYLLDIDLQREAAAKGEEYQPDPEDDSLESALAILEAATVVAPLDRPCRHLIGVIATHFDDKQALVERSFNICLVLDPRWVDAPMKQADAWMHLDPDRTIGLWRVALERAARLDGKYPGTEWSKSRIVDRIREKVRTNPGLQVKAADLLTEASR